MTLLAPVWLWLLLPWAALFAYLLRATGRELPVPFIDLWKHDDPTRNAPRRPRRLPPAWVLAVLAATFAAILAAAGPAVRASDPQPAFHILLDAGSTMTPRRIADALAAIAAHPKVRDARSVSVTIVPSPDASSDTSERMSVERLASLDVPASGVDMREWLHRQIRDHLARHQMPLIVVTDQRLAIDDPRLIQVPPEQPLRNAGIERLSVGVDPRPQAMVRVLNQSAATTTTLRVQADDRTIEQPVDLPPSGQSRNVFVDLAVAPQQLQAELVLEDDVPFDNRARLTRQGSRPSIHPVGPLPPAVARMLEVYADQRPPTPGAPQVVVTTDPARLPAGVTGAVALAGSERLAAGAMLTIVDHAVTRHVPWDEWARSMVVADAPLPRDVQPLVRVGDRVLVGVRESPVRQVWLATDTTAYASTPQFVILWTNVLTWLGGDGVTYVADDRGALAARIVEPPPVVDWRARLRDLPPDATQMTSYAPHVLLVAMALGGVAIALAPPSRRGRSGSRREAAAGRPAGSVA